MKINLIFPFALLSFCASAMLVSVEAQQPTPIPAHRSSNSSGVNIPAGATARVCPLCHGKGCRGMLTVYERDVTLADGTRQTQRWFGIDPCMPRTPAFDPDDLSCNVVGFVPGVQMPNAGATTWAGYTANPNAIGPDWEYTGDRFDIPSWIRTRIDTMGSQHGCWSCGRGVGRATNWIPDHIAPVALSHLTANGSDFLTGRTTIDYYYRPHDSDCQKRQGGRVNAVKSSARSWERKWRAADIRVNTYTDRGTPNVQHRATFLARTADLVASGHRNVTYRAIGQ